ncbi:unnamed protein product [Caenorhabditis sp. 36 PRJEB53466]|nr:unnamed protein product [Caenorhabditis sp. 36 PRJEB53466]
MRFTQLDDLTCLIAQIGFFTSSISVLLFNFLTIFFVNRDFGTYQYVVHPMIHSYNTGFVFFTNPKTPDVSNELMRISLVTFCGLYGSTICFIAVQFLYRYWALFDVEKLKYFEGWTLSLWFFYSFSIGALWAIGIYHFLEIDQFSTLYFYKELSYHYGLNLTSIPSFTSVIYTEDRRIRWWNLMCTVEMTIILGSQYSIICFCGQRMSVGMKEKISMLSQTRRRLHTQFFKSLVLQIVVPSVVLFLPVIIIVYLPLLDVQFSFPTGVIFSAFALYPTIDTIIILYIVSDYRSALRRLLLSVRSRINSAAPHYFHHEPFVVPRGGRSNSIALHPSIQTTEL